MNKRRWTTLIDEQEFKDWYGNKQIKVDDENQHYFLVLVKSVKDYITLIRLEPKSCCVTDYFELKTKQVLNLFPPMKGLAEELPSQICLTDLDNLFKSLGQWETKKAQSFYTELLDHAVQIFIENGLWNEQTSL